jgi:hypothetical protein
MSRWKDFLTSKLDSKHRILREEEEEDGQEDEIEGELLSNRFLAACDDVSDFWLVLHDVKLGTGSWPVA